jgi:uncharacterized protein
MTTPPDAADSTATLINVAQLLKAPVGTTRRYHLSLPSLDLGEGRRARGLEGDVKLTRLSRGLLVEGTARATVELTCVRCLEEYTQPLDLQLEEEYRPTIDMASGHAIKYAANQDEGDFFLIGPDHVLDLTEALRQAAWLAVPMMPRCREDCPGIVVAAGETLPPATVAERDEPAAGGDARLAILGDLLEPAAEPPPAVEPPPAGRRGRSRPR